MLNHYHTNELLQLSRKQAPTAFSSVPRVAEIAHLPRESLEQIETFSPMSDDHCPTDSCHARFLERTQRELSWVRQHDGLVGAARGQQTKAQPNADALEQGAATPVEGKSGGANFVSNLFWRVRQPPEANEVQRGMLQKLPVDLRMCAEYQPEQRTGVSSWTRQRALRAACGDRCGHSNTRKFVLPLRATAVGDQSDCPSPGCALLGQNPAIRISKQRNAVGGLCIGPVPR